MPAASAEPLSLASKLQRLKGVGPALAAKLENLGLFRVADLLFHLPSRYQDRTRITPIGALLPGQYALVQAQVELAQVRFGKRRSLLIQVADGTGALTLRLFHFSAAQKNQFIPGRSIRCFGEARRGPAGLELIHPEYQLFEPDDQPPVEENLRAVYPATDGVSQQMLQRLIGQALEVMMTERGKQDLKELLPPGSLADTAPELVCAIHLLHKPPVDISLEDLSEGAHPAQKRLAFEELLAHYLSLRRAREKVRKTAAPPLSGNPDVVRQLRANLGFDLTKAQLRVIEQIQADIGNAQPMLRLLQGDVGSGKTVVAAHAVLDCVSAGFQAAVMAPTELLARQHFSNLSLWLEPLGIRMNWLAGKMSKSARTDVLQILEQDIPCLTVGTHALVQDDVHFAKLGLVVVDEQHRFGVRQRLSLQSKGPEGMQPHQLIMTATPIPRTLAMTAYAELDTSTIDELPPGRQTINTVVIPDSRRPDIIARITDAGTQGRQIYWVCTLIEESEALQCQAAERTAETLAEALPDIRVGLLHGRMKDLDKDRVMGAFKAGELDLLVATTVIEVGVDVPNASLMIIENAERLGLAQLHQLRGRVGRGTRASDCVLMYHAPLSRTAQERLAILRASNDGFVIAEKDLELRGPGELLGTRQAGALSLRVANLARDAELLPRVKSCGDALLEQDPQTADELIQRWLAGTLQFIKA